MPTDCSNSIFRCSCSLRPLSAAASSCCMVSDSSTSCSSSNFSSSVRSLSRRASSSKRARSFSPSAKRNSWACKELASSCKAPSASASRSFCCCRWRCNSANSCSRRSTSVASSFISRRLCSKPALRALLAPPCSRPRWERQSPPGVTKVTPQGSGDCIKGPSSSTRNSPSSKAATACSAPDLGLIRVLSGIPPATANSES